MIASLPMYDRQQQAALTDRLWHAMRDTLRAGGIDAPDDLTRGGDPWEHWQSPDLLFGQTCSLPLRARLHRHLTLVANPDLGLPGTPPGHYHSVFIARRGEPGDLAHHAAGRFAFNDGLSHSGWAAPLGHIRQMGLSFTTLLETGAHRASAAAVAGGAADLAAIDAHSWRLLLAHEPELTGSLQVIGRTEASPALPYVTAFAALAPALRNALAGAIAADGAPLGLTGLVDLPLAAHLALPIPPNPRANARYQGVSVASATISKLQSAR